MAVACSNQKYIEDWKLEIEKKVNTEQLAGLYFFGTEVDLNLPVGKSNTGTKSNKTVFAGAHSWDSVIFMSGVHHEDRSSRTQVTADTSKSSSAQYSEYGSGNRRSAAVSWPSDLRPVGNTKMLHQLTTPKPNRALRHTRAATPEVRTDRAVPDSTPYPVRT